METLHKAANGRRDSTAARGEDEIETETELWEPWDTHRERRAKAMSTLFEKMNGGLQIVIQSGPENAITMNVPLKTNKRELEKDIIGMGSLWERSFVTEDPGHALNLIRLHPQRISMKYLWIQHSRHNFLGFSHHLGLSFTLARQTQKRGLLVLVKILRKIYLVGSAASKQMLAFKISSS